MVAIVYALIRAAGEGFADPRVLAGLLVGLATLGAFVAIEARTRAPIVPLGLFRDRRRAAGYTALLLIGPSLIGPFFFLTQYLQQVRGLGPVLTGCAFLPMTGGLFAAARLVPRVLGRFGHRRTIAGGLTALIAAVLLLSRVGPHAPYPAILGPLLLVGLGGGFAFVPLYTLILSNVTGQSAGAASGVLQTTQWLGGSFGLAILVAAAGHAGMGRAFLAAAVLALAALVLLAITLPAATKRDTTKAHPDGRLRPGGRERPDAPGHPDEVDQPSAPVRG
jgi:predicted MFS family arabinose efflux permease